MLERMSADAQAIYVNEANSYYRITSKFQHNDELSHKTMYNNVTVMYTCLGHEERLYF